MKDIDQMDLLRYLDVLARESQTLEEHYGNQSSNENNSNTVFLRRGTIDDVL